MRRPLDQEQRRFWILKARVIQMYNRGTPMERIAQNLNLPRRECSKILQLAMTDSPLIIRGDKETRRRLMMEKKVYFALNAYQGASAGFKVEWM